MKAFISAIALAALSSQVSAAPVVSTDGAIVDPLLFDGRIRPLYRSASFDNANTSVYNPQYILGSEPWSKVIKFPNVEYSLFDAPIKGKALTVTLNDKSIFVAGGTPQNGFRRTELLPAVNTGNDATVNGMTAHHWSVRFDPTRPLNYSHEYQPVFTETQTYDGHIWTLKTGTPFGSNWTIAQAKTLRVMGSVTFGVTDEPTLFSIPFTEGWHNFAIETDWVNNMVSVYYSAGQAALKLVAGPLANNAAGKGQTHFGLLKLPTGPSTIDVTHEGYQEKHINEGLTYGGIFIENAAANNVTRMAKDLLLLKKLDMDRK